MDIEIKRQAVKNILKEMSDNIMPFTQIMVIAIKEEWEEDRIIEEMLKSVSSESLSKSFDYYTNRIVNIFEEKWCK